MFLLSIHVVSKTIRCGGFVVMFRIELLFFNQGTKQTGTIKSRGRQHTHLFDRRSHIVRQFSELDSGGYCIGTWFQTAGNHNRFAELTNKIKPLDDIVAIHSTVNAKQSMILQSDEGPLNFCRFFKYAMHCLVSSSKLNRGKQFNLD